MDKYNLAKSKLKRFSEDLSINKKYTQLRDSNIRLNERQTSSDEVGDGSDKLSRRNSALAQLTNKPRESSTCKQALAQSKDLPFLPTSTTQTQPLVNPPEPFSYLRGKNLLKPYTSNLGVVPEVGPNFTVQLTEGLLETYKRCDLNFLYEPHSNPKRALTKPSQPKFNEGHDNEDHDLILYVNSLLGSEESQRYVVIDLLGQGTFGQVARCQNVKTKEFVAVKVIKGKQAYFNQSMMEIAIVELLNQRYDPYNRHHITRILDTFIHHSHLCLVFELLSVSLYDLIKQNKFRGLSPKLIRVFTKQILEGLILLSEARIIHADLKPENILLKDLDSPELKIIDFGSACHEHKTMYSYIQSRFYRSPEVILGLPYSCSIDMWSLGCILVELFLGLPLFPGTSEYNQMSRICELLGNPPAYMIDFGKHGLDFFNRSMDPVTSQRTYQLKTLPEYSSEQSCSEQPSKRYFPLMPIPELIRTYPILKKDITPGELDREMENRLKLTDFVRGLLNLNPIERWSPQQAILHPFVTGEPYRGKFVPPSIPKLRVPNETPKSPFSNFNQSSPNNMHSNIASFQPYDISQLDPISPHRIPIFPTAQSIPVPNQLKPRARGRSNTVNTALGTNIPAPIQQAATIATNSKLSPTTRTTARRVTPGLSDVKAQKRLSMPSPSTSNPKEDDIYELEEGLSKLGLKNGPNNTKSYDMSKARNRSPKKFGSRGSKVTSPLQASYSPQHGSYLHNVHVKVEHSETNNNNYTHRSSNSNPNRMLPPHPSNPTLHQGHKTRRTYSFGYEPSPPSNLSHHYNHYPVLPSGSDNLRKPIYQTRSASYAHPIEIKNNFRGMEGDTRGPKRSSTSQVELHNPAPPLHLAMHRPAYLASPKDHPPNPQQSSSTARRYTLSGTNQSHIYHNP